MGRKCLGQNFKSHDYRRKMQLNLLTVNRVEAHFIHEWGTIANYSITLWYLSNV